MAQAEIKRRLELNIEMGEEEDETERLPEIIPKNNESRQEIDKPMTFNLPSLVEVEEPPPTPPRPYRMHTTIGVDLLPINFPRLEKSHTIIGLLQEHGEQKPLDEEDEDEERGTPDPQAPTARSEIYDKLKIAGIVPQQKRIIPQKIAKKKRSTPSRRPSSMLSSFRERPTAHSIKKNEQVMIQNKVDRFFKHLERSTGTVWQRRIIIDTDNKSQLIKREEMEASKRDTRKDLKKDSNKGLRKGSEPKITTQVNVNDDITQGKKDDRLSTQVIERLLSIGAKVKNIPQGYPSNCAVRSNRHSATFKLRKLVKQMLANKTTFEEMKYNEAKKELLPDIKKL